MAFEQQASGLIDQTIQTFNGNVTAVSPQDGITLIDSWISAFRSTDEQANPISDSLTALKTELQKGNPSTSEISTILKALTDQARNAANSADTGVQTQVNALVDALKSFQQQLTGQAGPANTGGQAPMASTVGGNSSTSGVGTTTSGSTQSYMDDPTGSDGDIEPRGISPTTGTSSGQTDVGDNRSGAAYGTTDDAARFDQPDAGNTQGGGSYGSGYGTGSTAEKGTPNSGTERDMHSGPVGGGSISGGQSDSETGSSGGRSS
ncbi:hypothetical protein BN8_00825 [Fibrisoma limi BUZ 3]|uniref:Uncharacterized protein n=1 Tax=Fibrisoma limi BUZ 3 TaxID=1185876 RepID=I2GD95_9BACT|nr:hypothetical protein [Fibrisoma limi]CCH51869.1 hypothetical protein BN8_00825 [Fibrisoma limi BUZ 3]